jgi:hypothetical protein
MTKRCHVAACSGDNTCAYITYVFVTYPNGGFFVHKQVQELGEVPTIGDCGTLVRAAMRTPWPEAIISLLQHSHKLGYVFGR